MLNNFKYKFQRFMSGRYGNDDLNKFIMKVWFAALFISLLFGRMSAAAYLILNIISWSILLSMYYRMFSKDWYKRQYENQLFLSKKNYLMRRWNDRNTYKYFNCPTCKAHLRVPRHAGKITIHCRNCNTSFDRKA